jgi:arylsulfatase A-like enzyme
MRRLPSVDATPVAVGQLRALQAVDALVGHIVDTLAERGSLADTAIVYTSDNGHSWGEHRWLNKLVPHDESIRVPLVIRAPGTAPGTRTELVANIDIAPTIAALARVDPPAALPGRSLLPLLAGGTWPDERTVTLEAVQVRRRDSRAVKVPSYCGIRLNSLSYVQYATGEEELYDLTRDRYQMHNLSGSAAWRARLHQLRQLAASRCRPLPPVPAGWKLHR